MGPRIIDGGWRLVVAGDDTGRDLIVPEAALVADIVANPAAHQAIRLKIVDVPRQLGADAVGRVEPDEADRAVLGKQLVQLWLYLVL